jgi:hypothetical protein
VLAERFGFLVSLESASCRGPRLCLKNRSRATPSLSTRWSGFSMVPVGLKFTIGVED